MYFSLVNGAGFCLVPGINKAFKTLLSIFKRYLGGVVSATWYPSTQIQQLAYLLKDHIGSIHTVLNEPALITATMHATFTLMPAAYTSAVSVQVPGFEDI